MVTEAEIQARLSVDRLPEMAPYEKIVCYELVLLPVMRREGGRADQAGQSLNLGTAYLDADRYDEAVHYLNESIQGFEAEGEQEWSAKALVNLGIARRFLGEPGAALAAYQRAFEIGRRQNMPDVIEYSARNLLELLDEERFDEMPPPGYVAVEEQAYRFGLTELACDAGRLLGAALLGAGQYEAARQALDRARLLAEQLGYFAERAEILRLRRAGDYGPYRARLQIRAERYLAAGRPQLAAATFAKIISMPGCDAAVRLRIAASYLAADQWASADELFPEIAAESTGPAVADLALELGVAAAAIERRDAAQEYARTAIRLYERNEDTAGVGQARSLLRLISG
ncbi:tetratricopeptide repeat protein [Actinomadura scrupuli]|uniref:tetratricopeptide repeat protein n=1 Tax=Actinomadura scrupuli TaxID=559629 RepID=UPI003D987CCA